MARILDLLQHGQSLWLDYISRDLLVEDGGLRRLVEAGLRGVTSNPTIFHQAITGSRDYDDAICDLLEADHGMDAATLYEWLCIQDVQAAADILEPLYRSSDGADGYVSLEVPPELARDAAGTLRAARHLWKSVNRPNLMIKVPGTVEALPAIEDLIAEGVNVNVTLLFAVERYVEVARAYVRGLARNGEPQRVASVASFFVSRVDTKVDAALAAIGSDAARRLQGRIAIANAKHAYRRFQELLKSDEFAAHRRRGARPQRPLWASTSTKNPAYRDVLYVEELIGADTVNTVPPATLDAFLDHGEVREALVEGVDDALEDLERLARLGIDLAAVTRELESEGIRAFADSHTKLLLALGTKRAEAMRAYAGE